MVYIVTSKYFKHQKFYDEKSLGYEMNFFDSIDIDDIDDWKLAEILMKYNNE